MIVNIVVSHRERRPHEIEIAFLYILTDVIVRQTFLSKEVFCYGYRRKINIFDITESLAALDIYRNILGNAGIFCGKRYLCRARSPHFERHAVGSNVRTGLTGLRFYIQYVCVIRLYDYVVVPAHIRDLGILVSRRIVFAELSEVYRIRRVASLDICNVDRLAFNVESRRIDGGIGDRGFGSPRISVEYDMLGVLLYEFHVNSRYFAAVRQRTRSERNHGLAVTRNEIGIYRKRTKKPTEAAVLEFFSVILYVYQRIVV